MPLPAFLLPMLGGAAAGAGIGALSSPGGFSDDEWWKGALLGGATGGLGGHFGLFGGPAAGGSTGLGTTFGQTALANASPSASSLFGTGGSVLGSKFGEAALANASPSASSLFGTGGSALGSKFGQTALANASPSASSLFGTGGSVLGSNFGQTALANASPSESGGLLSFLDNLTSTDNMYKGLIASSLMKNLRGQNDDIKPPPPVAPSFQRASPPPANVAGVRRPIMGGGFMGSRRGGLGSRRY